MTARIAETRAAVITLIERAGANIDELATTSVRFQRRSFHRSRTELAHWRDAEQGQRLASDALQNLTEADMLARRMLPEELQNLTDGELFWRNVDTVLGLRPARQGVTEILKSAILKTDVPTTNRWANELGLAIRQSREGVSRSLLDLRLKAATDVIDERAAHRVDGIRELIDGPDLAQISAVS